MLDNKGFDLWADGYDKAVGLSDEDNTYPFAGYKAVLGEIFRRIMSVPGASVLDIGFGTGTLTAKLYERGCSIYGQDFSGRMIEIAQEKMPDARLYQGDFSKGLAEPLLERKYDFIVATYSLHHLADEQKIPFISMLLALLKDGGKLLIGDIAFESAADLRQCRADAGTDWDEDEYYFVADELRKAFPYLSFIPESFCAGILTIGLGQ